MNADAQLDRRSFLKYSAVIGVGTSAASMLTGANASAALGMATPAVDASFPWIEATIADMQAAMASGEATALSITRDHLARIERMDWAGPQVNSIIEVNPDAEAIALELDRERAQGRVRGPLHGIPIVLKDVVATADRMETTAASFALRRLDRPARRRCGGAAPRGRRDPARQGQHVRVERLPWLADSRWVERSSRRGAQPVRAELQHGGLQLGVGGRGRGEFRRRRGRARDVRLDRDAVVTLRRRRPEADVRARQSLGHDPDLVHP